MMTLGVWFWSLGLSLVVFAMAIFDTSLDGRVINLDLQQKQTLMVIIGMGFFLAGTILHAIAHFNSPKSAEPRHSPRTPSFGKRADRASDEPPPIIDSDDEDVARQLADSRSFSQRY